MASSLLIFTGSSGIFSLLFCRFPFVSIVFFFEDRKCGMKRLNFCVWSDEKIISMEDFLPFWLSIGTRFLLRIFIIANSNFNDIWAIKKFLRASNEYYIFNISADKFCHNFWQENFWYFAFNFPSFLKSWTVELQFQR